MTSTGTRRKRKYHHAIQTSAEEDNQHTQTPTQMTDPHTQKEVQDEAIETSNNAPLNDESSSSCSAPLSSGALSSFHSQLSCTGLVYFSHLPPCLSPLKLRRLLSCYGEINRLFLTPESSHITHHRRLHGGRKRKSFVDGWVEFCDKRIAKRVAITLNNTLMGGKKRSYYHDDMWSCKYLKGFKWNHLTEKIGQEEIYYTYIYTDCLNLLVNDDGDVFIHISLVLCVQPMRGM